MIEEFIKVLEQILYMENFNAPITDSLKVKFLGLYDSCSQYTPEKYKSDVVRLKTKFSGK